MKTEELRKYCPSVTLSTTNSTQTDPGLCSERLAANRLSYGTTVSGTLVNTQETQVIIAQKAIVIVFNEIGKNYTARTAAAVK
jgi:hypothetical protein